jgi:hypothetical protein
MQTCPPYTAPVELIHRPLTRKFAPIGLIASIACTIGRVLTDVELLSRLRSGVQKLAARWFSWPKTIARTLGTFEVSSDAISRPYAIEDNPSLGRKPKTLGCLVDRRVCSMHQY